MIARRTPPALLVAAGLVVLDLLVFAQVRRHEFITLDDGLYITQNPAIQHGLTWAGLVWAFTTGHAANWHPLTWLSHMLDVQMFGLWPGGHHLTSLVLHIANTLLLFFGLQWITAPPDRPGATLGRSAVVAALFSVHPLHVESVAWAAERKDVLSTLFWWLTIGAYVAYVRRPGWIRYALVVVAFGLGLMAKPMLVTVPFVLLLLDVWPLGRAPFDFAPLDGARGKQGRGRDWIPLIREKLPLFALSAASTIVTFVVQRGGGAVVQLGHLPVSNRVANAFLSYGLYLWKAVWPAHLAVFYPYPRAMPLGWAVCSLAVVVALSVVAWRWARRYPYVGVGWLWYLATLLPVIGLIQVGSQAIADRYTYVPLVGLLVAGVWGVDDLAARWSVKPVLTAAAASLVILACAAAARLQTSYWTGSIALWQHAIAVTTGNFEAYGALGALLGDQGKADEALDMFSKAVTAYPNYPNTHFDLGYQLMSMGRADAAAAEYTEALRLNPDYAEAHQSLGVALALNGRTGEAIDHYRQAIRLDPHLATAHASLGVALGGQGKFEEAVKEYVESLRLDPSVANVHYRLGAAHAALGRTDDAIAAYREALRLEPELAEAHNDLGFLLYASSRTDEAIVEYSTAIRARPNYPEAFNNRGMALGARQKFPEAFADFTEAIRLRPDFESAHYWRGLILAGTERYAEARREFGEVLRLNPSNEGALRALAEIARRGK